VRLAVQNKGRRHAQGLHHIGIPSVALQVNKPIIIVTIRGQSLKNRIKIRPRGVAVST
jgi:hypothetical protein